MGATLNFQNIGRPVPGSGNARASGYERHEFDWYREPRHAIDGLLNAEPFAGGVYDPACGSGNIPKACIDRGFTAFGSDIIDRGYGWRADFLACTDRHVDNIITNPPFKIAVAFTLHALELAQRKVAILQRTTWLEGETRYQHLFSRGGLARVWQFRRRISMPPGDSGAEAKGGSVAFAWFVWDREHCGPPTLGWLP